MRTLKGLIDYRKDITSQSGENGILSELLKRLGMDSGTLIEFGAADGRYASNTYHLLSSGKWKCIYIEPHDKYKDLEKLKVKYKNLVTLNMPVHTLRMPEYTIGTSLDEIIQRYAPKVDLVSIDIDSYDYHIFKELVYKPPVVIIEINAFFIPTVEYIDRQNPKIYGSSFLSMLKLGESKGYKLVVQPGCNCFFVREDLCEGFELPDPYELFDWTFIKEYKVKYTEDDKQRKVG